MTPWHRRPRVRCHAVLLVRQDVAFHHLLVADVDQDVARNVRREHGAGSGGAERALRQLAVGRSQKDAAPVLELVDVARRLPR